MAAQLGLPDALRRRGLVVEVVPGWETRSAGSFAPRGAVCHWTAGPPNSKTRPSLNIVVNGRPDLDGPLANVYLDRNGVAVVVAAGRANHAGAGVWRSVTGNSSFFGTEAEAAGPTDFTLAQRIAYPKVNAAYCDLGRFGPEMVCGHSEYATPQGRKTDINGYTMDDMRREVAAILNGTPPTVIGGFLMALSDAEQAEVLRAVRELTAPRVLPRSGVPAGIGTIGDIAVNTDRGFNDVVDVNKANLGTNISRQDHIVATRAEVRALTEKVAAIKPATATVSVDAAAVAAALATNPAFLAAVAKTVNDDAAKRLSTS